MVASAIQLNRNGSLNSRMSAGSKDSNTCPMKRPTRRPSIDTCSSSYDQPAPPPRDEEEPLKEQVTQEEQPEKKEIEEDEKSVSTSSSSQEDDDDFLDDDDDATQITSNHSAGKAPKRGSGTTSTTAKSSTSGHVIPRLFRDPPILTPLPTETLQDELHSKPGEIIAFDDVHELEGGSIGEMAGSHHTNSSSHSGVLTPDRVRSFMKDYYEDWNTIVCDNDPDRRRECLTALCEQYMTPGITWIRPSGNPLDKAGLIKLFTEDIVAVRSALVSIESIQVMAGGMAAVVVFTADQEFLYKGQYNSDRCVTTAVLHTENDGKGGIIKIGHEHRCVGKPVPKESRWEA